MTKSITAKVLGIIGATFLSAKVTEKFLESTRRKLAMDNSLTRANKNEGLKNGK